MEYAKKFHIEEKVQEYYGDIMMKTPEQLKGAIRNLQRRKESMHRKSADFYVLKVSLNVFLFPRTRTDLF